MHTIKDIVKQLIGKSLDAYNTNYTKVVNTRIDNIVAQAGNDNTEIVDARIDSAGVTHTTLNNRILAETKMVDQQMTEYIGYNLTATETMPGAIQDLEVLGNTIQNEEDLADIKSVGVLQEDGTYKMSILSCGKNLFNSTFEIGGIFWNSGLDNNNELDRVRSGFIKINPNATYRVSEKNKLNPIFTHIFFFDENKTFIKFGGSLGEMPSNTSYIRFLRMGNGTSTEIYLQLEEGTQATPYEPYQGNKCDILLPCQLEKVGNVSDILYYDDMENAWCIEKNVETLIINGTKQNAYVITGNTDTDFIKIGYILTEDTYDKYKGVIANIKSILSCRSEVEFKNNSLNTECVSLYNGGNTYSIYLSLYKAKYGDNLESVLNKLEEDNLYLYVVRLTPQKIILPLSTQIVLNSFFGTTHVYMESGEVEGTIKCKIPKSIGATVQSLNNKTDILSDRIETIEGLKDSQNMKYETDKGYLVCKETKNGVIDDLKIEGKTLVNLISDFNTWSNMGSTTVSEDGSSITINASAWNKGRQISKNLPSGNYIFSVTNPNEATIVVQDKTNARTLYIGSNANIDFEFSILKDIELLITCKNTSETGTYVVSNPILTTDKNFNNYFKGLMSVGQDVDEIEVLSNNRNLFDANQHIPNGWSNGNMIANNIFRTYWIKCEPNTTYFVESDKSGNRFGVCCGDMIKFNGEVFTVTKGQIFGSSDDTGKIVNAVFTTDSTAKYLFVYTVNNGVFPVPKIMICKSDTQVDYIKPDRDKKQILFYNSNGELEPIQELHEWDSIEKHSDNKWYYHKRSAEMVVDNTKDIKLSMEYDNTIRFALEIADMVKPTSNVIIVDKFVVKEKQAIFNEDTEGVANEYGSNRIYFRILKTKLSSQDVEGFKQWLQANPVTVVYQLAQEEVYELTPLHLDSYANETLILCNSGTISPKMEFSITSHINELVKTYGERINLLEEKVYKYMVIQNRMQLASTYSADNVTFKVDYFSLCGDEENYDEDLYNLILNNILVGKDNYDYNKMFNIIMDYASWSQISWDQFDILVGIMDMQHNPPVEDEIVEEIPNEVM